MPFSATINLGTVGVAITSVKLYGCTGNSGTDCTGCIALTGYENVSVSTFPLLVSGIPTGVRYIQAEALGACSADEVKQCISISGIPGPTATPNPTMSPTPSGTNGTTPNPTATQTLTPTPTPSGTNGTTPNPTATQQPTPTPTITSNCVTSVQFEVDSAGEVRYVDCCGNTIYETYGIGPQVINDCLQNGSLYALDANISFINYGATSCSCPPPTATPTETPLPPVVTFSTSYGTNTSNSYGTTGSTYNPTITVENATATIRLSVSVQTGDQADSTITISGGGSFSPSPAQGAGNTTFVEFTLGVGVYTNVTWVIQAIYGGSFTVATATLTQV